MVHITKTNKVILIAICFISGLFIIFKFIALPEVKKNYFGFQKLKIDSINSVVLYKFKIIDLNDSIVLSDDQSKKFIDKWNQSYPVGPVKCVPQYLVKVYMKNHEVRSFSIQYNVIKENSSYGFEFFTEKDYFNNLWKK